MATMMPSNTYLPPAEYPNHLASPYPERVRYSPAYGLLLLLVLACLLPRAVMAWRIPSVCPDGVLYIHIAESLEAGDLRAAMQDMALNTYPAILAGLHQLGFNWETGAAIWGVLVASLVVLPLWGWVRRQFDDRVALAACLLYVVHPKLIEWSPEVMRDPTFWLIFTLAIYWLWRAVTEVRYGYFVAAGTAITLAALTRTEGLFLLVPLALWSFWRWRALETGRRKLLVGAVLCVAAFPMLLVVINLAWLYRHSGFTAIRIDPLARVGPWLESVFGHGAAPAGVDQPFGVGRMLWVFIPTMTRGLSPVFALLMFGGIWGWRRVWARRDNQALFYVAVLVMCGIWVQLWYDRNICPRYALPIVLMASPFAALGALGLIRRMQVAADWPSLHGSLRTAVTPTVVAILALVCLIDAMTSNMTYFETRRMAADLGRWVRQQYPVQPLLVGPVGITPIASFYAADAPHLTFRWEADDDAIIELVDRSRPSVVLLRPTKQLTAQRCESLVAQLTASGELELLDSAVLPPNCDDLNVLVRAEQPEQTISQRAACRAEGCF